MVSNLWDFFFKIKIKLHLIPGTHSIPVSIAMLEFQCIAVHESFIKAKKGLNLCTAITSRNTETRYACEALIFLLPTKLEFIPYRLMPNSIKDFICFILRLSPILVLVY